MEAYASEPEARAAGEAKTTVLNQRKKFRYESAPNLSPTLIGAWIVEAWPLAGARGPSLAWITKPGAWHSAKPCAPATGSKYLHRARHETEHVPGLPRGACKERTYE